jgi:hypothetical protein
MRGGGLRDVETERELNLSYPSYPSVFIKPNLSYPSVFINRKGKCEF